MAHRQIDADGSERSLRDLTKDLARGTSTLVRKEVELAKLELEAKGRTAAPGIVMFAAAGVLGLALLGALTAGLILIVAIVIPAWAAAFAITGLWALLAGALALVGRARIRKAAPLQPEQTAETVREDIDWAKETLLRERSRQR